MNREQLREEIARLLAVMDGIRWHYYADADKLLRVIANGEFPILAQLLDLAERKAPIVCLCGSTRFTGEMLVKQWELTKQGYIVVSWCALPDWYYEGDDKTHIGDQEGVKEIVDEVHLRKIDLADEVFVINIGGYIGESTRREIEYARSIGKKVSYLESRLGEDS